MASTFVLSRVFAPRGCRDTGNELPARVLGGNETWVQEVPLSWQVLVSSTVPNQTLDSPSWNSPRARETCLKEAKIQGHSMLRLRAATAPLGVLCLSRPWPLNTNSFTDWRERCLPAWHASLRVLAQFAYLRKKLALTGGARGTDVRKEKHSPGTHGSLWKQCYFWMVGLCSSWHPWPLRPPCLDP